jgi:ATP-dependent Lon protease
MKAADKHAFRLAKKAEYEMKTELTKAQKEIEYLNTQLQAAHAALAAAAEELKELDQLRKRIAQLEKSKKTSYRSKVEPSSESNDDSN